jgi:hypothetical protein
MKLHASVACVEQQRSILQGEQGERGWDIIRYRGRQGILLMAIILEDLKPGAGNEP